MADTTGVLARLQAALSVYDPTWDVSVGSATYKILESVAQEIAIANNNSVLQSYSYDITTKAGSDLDSFTSLFGVYRQLGKRATGIVTFNIGAATNSVIDIPIGTQVAVPIGNGYTSAIYFSTITPAIIGIGDTSVDVPVSCTIAGIVGNVPAGAITTLVSSLMSVTSVTNSNQTSGGLEPESDTALRARWQNTAFSNTTGTYGKYNLTAQQNPNVNLVNTVGTQMYYSEQLQVLASVSGTGPATFCYVAYSGMTVNTSSGTVTYSGAPTVVAYSGFSSGASSTAVASGLQALLSGIAPSYYITISSTNPSNTITNGFSLSYSNTSPYRLILGSGNTIPGNSVTTSGVTTISGTSFTTYVQSANPDIGVSGTMSYNGAFNGALYPEGNELVGVNLNSFNQATFALTTDYVYPNNPTPQLTINLPNGSNNSAMFVGSNIQVISEYIPACSRSTSVASGNYVDIFINGTTSSSAYEQAVFNPSFTLSSGNSNPMLNTVNYTVASGNVAATITGTTGDYYVPLDVQPVINFPSQLNLSTSGVADTFFLFNNTTGSGYTYPIALNKYPYVVFSGTAASGTNFISVNNASGFLYPGLALASGIATSGTQYFISSVSSSGVYLNQTVSNNGAPTTTTFSGKAIAYPIYDTTDNKNSTLQTTAIAIDSTTPPNGWPSLPTNASVVTYNHGYNSDVVSVGTLIQQSRPFGTNTLVHQASFIPLIINANIVFSSNYTPSIVQTNISNQLSNYFGNFNYLGTISFNAIANQILSAPGVANVKITSINTTSVDGTIVNTFAKDFILASNQLPSLYNVVYTVKGASTF